MQDKYNQEPEVCDEIHSEELTRGEAVQEQPRHQVACEPQIAPQAAGQVK